MITGKITINREAIIELEVIGSNQKKEKVEAVIDTGFNGYLTLPNDLINYLKLQPAGSRRTVLGDGNIVVLDMYLAKVLWHGQEQDVLALQAEGGPLIGMSLLYGSRLVLEVIDNGDVTIDFLV
ncbi:MAG: clan AA aspartic protease [Candidatus Poribacteria bacterium]|nr:clan AA aspartic protease [Candidatus Poribacteria bacterium]